MHNQYNNNEKIGAMPAISRWGGGYPTVSAGGALYLFRMVFADNLCIFGGN